MPKLRLRPEEALNLRIKAKIEFGKTMYDYTNEKLALSLGISTPTFTKKLKNPEQFTLFELRILARKFHIPMALFVGSFDEICELVNKNCGLIEMFENARKDIENNK